MDEDLAQKNDVIGILRLPLSGLDLEFSQGHQVWIHYSSLSDVNSFLPHFARVTI